MQNSEEKKQMPKKGTLDWFYWRKEELEKKDSVKWYIRYEKKSNEFKKDLKRKYNKYIEESKTSTPSKTYFEMRDAFLSGNMKRVQELRSIARKKLVDGDFEMSPAFFDPSRIQYDPHVSQYTSVLSELGLKEEKENSKLKDDIFDSLM